MKLGTHILFNEHTTIIKIENTEKEPLSMVSSYFMGVLGREALEDHSQLPKKANKCSVRAVASFSYVWRHRHVRVIPT